MLAPPLSVLVQAEENHQRSQLVRRSEQFHFAKEAQL